ncbi:PorT family protein [Halosquirtibacter xylanolyticus]|uniref:porin family protein n=1 Tax=Halosquirtibacter xylanolyticus TaxID=3374599 RepID=UPI00374931DE|nr:PorT family protein [Prolixibacteraceae bacterium]
MKRVFLIVLLLSVSLGAFAQVLPFDIGLKAGWNSSKVTTDNFSTDISDYSPSNNSGYLIGFYSRIHMKKFFIQPELYFQSKKGETTLDLSDGSKVDYEVDFKTINVPILIGYRFLKFPMFKVQAFTGPVMIFNTNSNVKVSDPSLGSATDPSGMDWGYQLGVGVDIALFTIDARYEWGLSNVDGGIGDISFDQKSNMITFSVGWKFL